MSTEIYNPRTQDLTALLVGHSVKKVDDDTLVLDNAVRLTIEGNRGCGGCSSGWYYLTELNGCENVITRVEQDVSSVDGYDYGSETRYTVFVYADRVKSTLAVIEGDDGNGYYGTGFSIIVTGVDE